MRKGGLWQLGQSITRRVAQDKKTIVRRCFASEAELEKTALYDFHVANGGRCLFDIAHMCGLSLKGKDCIHFLEKLVVADLVDLAPGSKTLTVFTNEKGGAIDDLVITKVTDDHIYLVVNTRCRDKDLAHIEEHMKASCQKLGMCHGTSMMNGLF
ncbi:unnamed protein product [Fraxinus pennsylvanica]|uniref:aminomethyltransferase n=1 Tax=Fraxinus pennsylvanica TaxID=56036 RepID=A0AAD2EDE5_9LAMI|nr:unnamed protein product [Fraxinus pennsylvanica]